MTTRDEVNIVLKIIGLSGFSGLVAPAPNATKGLELLLKKKSIRLSSYKAVLKELKRQSLIQITNNKHEFHFVLTPSGAHRLQRIAIKELTISKPRRWDDKWRLVSFDIPIKYSRERALFTSHLQRLGFKLLQKSIWAYPYPCFKQVEQIAGYYNVLRYCSLLETSYLDELSSRRLRANFSNLR